MESLVFLLLAEQYIGGLFQGTLKGTVQDICKKTIPMYKIIPNKQKGVDSYINNGFSVITNVTLVEVHTLSFD